MKQYLTTDDWLIFAVDGDDLYYVITELWPEWLDVPEAEQDKPGAVEKYMVPVAKKKWNHLTWQKAGKVQDDPGLLKIAQDKGLVKPNLEKGEMEAQPKADEAQMLALKGKTLYVKGLGNIEIDYIGPPRLAQDFADKHGDTVVAAEEYPELQQLAKKSSDWVAFSPVRTESKTMLERLDFLIHKLESAIEMGSGQMVSIAILDDKAAANKQAQVLKDAGIESTAKSDRWGFWHVQVDGDVASKAYDLLHQHKD